MISDANWISLDFFSMIYHLFSHKHARCYPKGGDSLGRAALLLHCTSAPWREGRGGRAAAVRLSKAMAPGPWDFPLNSKPFETMASHLGWFWMNLNEFGYLWITHHSMVCTFNHGDIMGNVRNQQTIRVTWLLASWIPFDEGCLDIWWWRSSLLISLPAIGFLHQLQVSSKDMPFNSYWCLVGNGWEWGNGIIITSDCGSFPRSLLSASQKIHQGRPERIGGGLLARHKGTASKRARARADGCQNVHVELIHPFLRPWREQRCFGVVFLKSLNRFGCC